MNSPESSQWKSVLHCPLCGEANYKNVGRLLGESYSFGQEVIPFPDDGIGMAECPRCSLFFKLTIPAPVFLSEVIARQIKNIWNLSCDFSIEKSLIEEEIGPGSFDMLDIGASRGEFLAAFSTTEGRRSALDVVMHPVLEKCLRGEFIHGFIDYSTISWSGDPYDLLVMFDVLEHLYDPAEAFCNLVRMVKSDGDIVIETGDADSAWANRYGISNWYYAGVFEHHVFWTEKALQFAASQYGLKIKKLVYKRHKYVRTFSITMTVKLTIKAMLYQLSPKLYYRLGQLGNPGFNVQPASPFVRDHMFVVLSKGTGVADD